MVNDVLATRERDTSNTRTHRWASKSPFGASSPVPVLDGVISGARSKAGSMGISIFGFCESARGRVVITRV